MSSKSPANRVLWMNTIAFTACFAVWTMYGVLITFLVDHRFLNLDKGQIGWLIGVPILTGSILRLPVGLMTDKYGGKPVFLGILLLSSLAVFLTSFANSFTGFLVGGLAFGVTGAGFAAGVAYSSVWFPKERQGTALGIFGMGNAGSALTSLGAPHLLNAFTGGGQDIQGWRHLPQAYALMLLVMAGIYALVAVPKKAPSSGRTMGDMLRPLKDIRVWRFGLYYFVVFGAFVALAQWLIPYYLNVYGMSLATAGFMAAVYSLPSGVIRALGGWASDKFGARTTMYWVLSTCAVFFLMLVAPRMEITSPGEGVMAERAGVVTAVNPTSVTIGEKVYTLKERPTGEMVRDDKTLVMPTFRSWQEPAVQPGQTVKKKELLARGVTHVFFQANVWVFTALVFLAGIMMGVGKAAVFKHIPEYFPHDVGVVGGLVGVIGGLGGFFCPILFGYLLKLTGLWTSCWFFLALLTVLSLVWMHLVILNMGRQQDRLRAETITQSEFDRPNA
jgi:NNP family nitrate/nitrite transporter-like MFS transporter